MAAGRGEPKERAGGKASFAAGMAGDLGYPASTPCPFCGGSETELHSPFGSALSVATYWCRRCRTAFEWIKWG